MPLIDCISNPTNFRLEHSARSELNVKDSLGGPLDPTPHPRPGHSKGAMSASPVKLTQINSRCLIRQKHPETGRIVFESTQSLVFKVELAIEFRVQLNSCTGFRLFYNFVFIIIICLALFFTFEGFPTKRYKTPVLQYLVYF